MEDHTEQSIHDQKACNMKHKEENSVAEHLSRSLDAVN